MAHERSIKEKIRRMNETAVAAGFGPMSAQEIEALLTRHELPTPINSAKPIDPQEDLSDFIEGGFINDPSGEKTIELRDRFGIAGGQ